MPSSLIASKGRDKRTRGGNRQWLQQWLIVRQILISPVSAPISAACQPNSACCASVTLRFDNRLCNTRRRSRSGLPPTTTSLPDTNHDRRRCLGMTTAALPPSLFPLEVPLPSKEETSLSSKAMLCTVSISAWSGYKYDREASEQIAEIHGAEKDSGRFNKLLVPRKELEEITKIIAKARRDHEFVTLPWSDNGYRVLPAAAYMDHTNTMRANATEFQSAVSRLAARFEELVTNQSRLGTLFKGADYPGMRDDGARLRFFDPAELHARFSFETY